MRIKDVTDQFSATTAASAALADQPLAFSWTTVTLQRKSEGSSAITAIQPSDYSKTIRKESPLLVATWPGESGGAL